MAPLSRRVPLLFPAAAGLAALALAGAGCDGSAPGEGADTLVVALASDVRDLLPVLYQSPTDGNVVEALNVPLFSSAFDCALKFKPALAKDWRFSDDGRTLRVDLRSDVRWPDGTVVTAEDVAFSWRLLADPKVRSPKADLLDRLAPGAPHVVDERTLEWTFEAAYDRAAMLALVAGVAAVPKHLLDGPGVDRSSLRGHPLNVQSPVGNGPWKLVERVKGARLVLAPNERYTGPEELRPRLGRVELQVIPEYADKVAALKAGTVDLVEGVLVEDADVLAAEHPEIALRRRGWRSVEYVAWNAIDPADWKAKSSEGPGVTPADAKAHRLFADRDVRRALAMAIDTDGLIRALLTSATTGEVYGRPAVGTITPALCGVHNDAVLRLPHAPEDARAALAELGWTDSNNDGWLDKDGETFRFTLITNAAWPRRTKAAGLVKEQLAKVGVDVAIEQIEPVPFYERLRARDFDAALSSWSASLYADPSPIWGEGSEFNFTSYRNPRVSELLARGLAEPNADAAAATWRELQAAIYEDQPYAFLYWTDEIVAVRARYEDATVDVLGGWRELHRWRVAGAPAERAP